MLRSAWFQFLAALSLTGGKASAQSLADDLNGLTRVLDKQANLTVLLSLLEVGATGPYRRLRREINDKKMSGLT